MSESSNNVAGSCASPGLSDFVITSTPATFEPLLGNIPTTEYRRYKAFTAAGAWERGRGQWTAGTNTLARGTIYKSSNANAKVNFSGVVTIYIVDDTETNQNLDYSTDGSAKVAMTVGERSKVGFIAVTQAVDLDAMEAAGVAATAGLAAHIADTADAHDASAVSVLDTAGLYTATDVEGALTEVYVDKANILLDLEAGKVPILLFFGDSNMLNGMQTNTSLQTANNNVYVLTELATVPQNQAALTWQNVDPNAPEVVGNYNGAATVFWGIIPGGSCAIAWAAADKIQKELNCPIGLVCVAKSGSQSTYWKSTGPGNEGYVALNTYLTSKLATFPALPGYPTPPTHASVVSVSCGINDRNIGNMSAQTFTDNFATIRAEFDAAGWTKENHSLWLHHEPARANGGYVNNAWLGMEYLDAQTSEFVRVVTSAGLTTFEAGSNALHWDNAGANQYGLRIAKAALKGVGPKTLNKSGNINLTNRKIVSVSNGDIDIEPHGTGNVLLGNFTFNADQVVDAAKDNYVLTYDHAAATIGLEVATGGGLANVVEDTSPTLGGDLDGGAFKLSNISRVTNTGGWVGKYLDVSLSNVAYIPATADPDLKFDILRFTGTLTASCTVFMPLASTCLGQRWTFYNNTTVGAYKLTLGCATAPTQDEFRNYYQEDDNGVSQILAQGEMIEVMAVTGGWIILNRRIDPQRWWNKTTSGTGQRIYHHERQVIINVAASGTSTYGLPSYWECYGMGEFIVVNRGGGTCTIQQTGGASVFYNGAAAAAASDTLATGEIGRYFPSSTHTASSGSPSGWMVLKSSVA